MTNKEDLTTYHNFLCALGGELGYPIIGDGLHDKAFRLIAIAVEITDFNTAQCNGCPSNHWAMSADRDGMEQEWEDELLADRERLFAEALVIIKEFCKDWSLYEDTDPRGGSVGIVFPSGRYNSRGGAECGWRVPEIVLTDDEEDDDDGNG